MNIGGVSLATNQPVLPAAPSSASSIAEGASFSGLLGQLLQPVASAHQQADQGVMALAAGQSDQLHQVLLDVAKADIAFRMVLEVRNRLTEAYQEIMRMQI